MGKLQAIALLELVLAFSEADSVHTSKYYKLAGPEKRYVKATKEARPEFRLLIALGPLIQATITEASTKVMICSGASVTNGSALYCTLDCFH